MSLPACTFCPSQPACQQQLRKRAPARRSQRRALSADYATLVGFSPEAVIVKKGADNMVILLGPELRWEAWRRGNTGTSRLMCTAPPRQMQTAFATGQEVRHTCNKCGSKVFAELKHLKQEGAASCRAQCDAACCPRGRGVAVTAGSSR